MRLRDNISMVFRRILLFCMKTIKLSIFQCLFMWKSNFGSFSLSDHIQHRSYSGYRNSTLAFSFLKQWFCCFFGFCWSGLWEKESNVPTAGDMRDFPAGHGTIDTFLYMLYRFLSMREAVSARCQLNNYQARLWIGCNGLWWGAFLITHLAKWWVESWTWTNNAMQNKKKQCIAKMWQTHLASSPSWSEPRRWPNSWARRRAITRPWFPEEFFWLFKVSLSKSIYQSSASGYHNFQKKLLINALW